MSFSLNNGKFTIAFTPSTETEKDSVACVVLSARDPKHAFKIILEQTKTNRHATSPEEFFAVLAAAKMGQTTTQNVFVLTAFSEDFQQSITSKLEKMESDLQRFIGLVRWRNAQWGPTNAVGSKQPAEWSVDESNWYLLPFTVTHSASVSVTMSFNEERKKQIEELFDEGASEPIYRELLREAVHVQSSSPRSSLALVVAAAEIASKAAVARLAPDFYGVDVLREDAPPAEKMYGDISQFDTKERVNGKALAPPDGLLEELRKAVSARNGLVHAGAKPLDRESLVRKTNAIRDLALLVDFYLGNAWAFDHLTESTKLSLLEASRST